jgi:2-(3-amino-3-carboxypropyl)histidine synthase
MVEFLFIPAYYKEEVVLTADALSKLKKFSTIALFGAVQYIRLDKVLSQLQKNGNKVLKSHGKRTSGDFQLLGCDCFSDSFDKDITKADAILYIGDGLFHPKALLMSSKKEIYMFNPIDSSLSTLTLKDIELQKKKYIVNLRKYISAERIGILVSTKTGQMYLKNALKLKESTKKKAYIFIDDTFNYSLMENYPFIECWVNTACPRIGTDDVLHMPKPLINVNDAFRPEVALDAYTNPT